MTHSAYAQRVYLVHVDKRGRFNNLDATVEARIQYQDRVKLKLIWLLLY